LKWNASVRNIQVRDYEGWSPSLRANYIARLWLLQIIRVAMWKRRTWNRHFSKPSAANNSSPQLLLGKELQTSFIYWLLSVEFVTAFRSLLVAVRWKGLYWLLSRFLEHNYRRNVSWFVDGRRNCCWHTWTNLCCLPYCPSMFVNFAHYLTFLVILTCQRQWICLEPQEFILSSVVFVCLTHALF
jgi:hypothetical protein